MKVWIGGPGEWGEEARVEDGGSGCWSIGEERVGRVVCVGEGREWVFV